MIPVTKPFMPPREEYQHYVQEIWRREYLTHNVPLVQGLEEKLKNHLDVEHLLYLSNSTIGLHIAVKALELKGEIITAPFFYVATTIGIVREDCKPVFADIDPASRDLSQRILCLLLYYTFKKNDQENISELISQVLGKETQIYGAK